MQQPVVIPMSTHSTPLLADFLKLIRMSRRRGGASFAPRFLS